jgi:hypothetical protein
MFCGDSFSREMGRLRLVPGVEFSFRPSDRCDVAAALETAAIAYIGTAAAAVANALYFDVANSNSAGFIAFATATTALGTTAAIATATAAAAAAAAATAAEDTVCPSPSLCSGYCWGEYYWGRSGHCCGGRQAEAGLASVHTAQKPQQRVSTAAPRRVGGCIGGDSR